ncbi:Uncharacterized protein DAT39_015413 [Clarias magur]|uniref:Uncharacterized protein n=1 Tax=Clarias magur TaxID=1594786 RepID=A0A8J4TQC7_CLAMG|nr:Uncharacterized protein DAT39_015413 [Clarias magur]
MQLRSSLGDTREAGSEFFISLKTSTSQRSCRGHQFGTSQFKHFRAISNPKKQA